MSWESGLTLVAILVGAGIAGGIAGGIIFFLMSEVWTPFIYYLFGNDSIVPKHYEQTGFADVLSWLPFVLLFLFAAFMTLAITSDAGLPAFIVGGAVSAGIAIGTFVGFDEFLRWNTPNTRDHERTMENALKASDFDLAFRIAGTNEYSQHYRHLRDTLEEGVPAGMHPRAVDRAVQAGMLDLRCVFYYPGIWHNATKQGFDLATRYGARIYSAGIEFRRNCPDKRRYREDHQLQQGLSGYVDRWRCKCAEAIKEFWKRGVYLSSSQVNSLLQEANKDLRTARSDRKADLEETLAWNIQVLEYIAPDPVARQRRLLERWGG